jgi:hypothetical protein
VSWLTSRTATAAMFGIVSLVSLVVLLAEFAAAPAWATCAQSMRESLVLCDAGPGDWVVGLTALLAVASGAAAGSAFERARRQRVI